MPISSVSERALVSAEETHLRTAQFLSKRIDDYFQDLSRGVNSVVLEAESTGQSTNFGPLFYTLGISQICQVNLTTLETTNVVANNSASCPTRLSKSELLDMQEAMAFPDAKMAVSTSNLNNGGTLRLYQSADDGKAFFASFSSDRLRQIAKQAEFDQFGHAKILDPQGLVISHPESSYEDEQSNFANQPYYKAAQETVKGSQRYDSDWLKVEMLVSFTLSKLTGISVYVAQPVSEIQQKTLNVQYGVLGVFLFGLAMAAAFAVAASKLVTKPMVQMVDVMNRIGAGELRAYEDMRYGKFQPIEFNAARSAIQVMSDKLRENIDSISQHAYLDSVTGLPNRECFRVLGAEEIERMRDSHWCSAILFLDLDGFKEVNDDFGHRTGDDLLVGFGERLHHYCSSFMMEHAGAQAEPLQVMPARLGGDEFVVLISRLESDYLVEQFANGLFDKVFGEITLPSRRVLEVNGSVGGSLFPIHAQSFDELLRLADIAMYAAKKNGKGRFVLYNPANDHSEFRQRTAFA